MRCFHPINVRQWYESADGEKKQSNSYHLVPCGKCVACLSRRRNDWSYRLAQEQKSSSYSFFLTLTYNDDEIPVSTRDGKFYYVFNKKHVQDYIKRVRYYIGEMSYKLSCRYLAVSEYGKKTLRPHYHMQFFVYGDDSLKYFKSICKILESNWTYGYFQRKPTNAANIHYVTKYCIKSLDDQNEKCLDTAFILCSKNPYLGYKAEENLEKQGLEPVVFNNGFKSAMPRIYRNKLGLSGLSIPESDHDPRLSKDGYEKILLEYRKTHKVFSMSDFTQFINSRFKQFENDAIRRQTARNDKL